MPKHFSAINPQLPLRGQGLRMKKKGARASRPYALVLCPVPPKSWWLRASPWPVRKARQRFGLLCLGCRRAHTGGTPNDTKIC